MSIIIQESTQGIDDAGIDDMGRLVICPSELRIDDAGIDDTGR